MRNGIKWMQDGPFGIMVHYLSCISDREGNRIDFNEMANKFDVPAFMDNLEKMGAKWLIFPFGQNTGYYWSENPVPVLGRGHLPTLEKIQEVPPSRRDEAHFS